MPSLSRLLALCLALSPVLVLAAVSPGARKAGPNLVSTIERPLRYIPEGTDFVIHNGGLSFNRSLYGGGTAFRAESGDRPIFALYTPGRGGVLRLGWKTPKGIQWADLASDIIARYRPGSTLHELRDPSLNGAVLRIHAIPYFDTEGLSVRVEVQGAKTPFQLYWAFGGANGEKGNRDGDLGTEKVPLEEWFRFRPEHTLGNQLVLTGDRFLVHGPKALILGQASQGSVILPADGRLWDNPAALFGSAGSTGPCRVALGTLSVSRGDSSLLLSLQRLTQPEPGSGHVSLAEVFNDSQEPQPATVPGSLLPAFRVSELQARHEAAEASREKLATKLVVDTPDPFLNAAVAALNLAGDGVWDTPTGTVMHGAVAWRRKLLGWRGPYLNDALGYHDRALSHISYWASRQNTEPVPSSLPGPDAEANLSRSEAALHSNGDLSNSHYDMNLVFIDMVFRHLLWTGDLKLAEQLWPMLERHLAWERRLFRRPYGDDGLPLYEGYCCIWASDDLYYSGGGATHATAYNYYHNLMAARLAKLLGKDAVPYETEASLIARAMERELWIPGKGVFAESRDWLGLRRAHTEPALWTFYHTIDSLAASPRQAWQMSRYVDTQLAHIPVRGPGVPSGDWYTLPTTNWMPYTWSTNNVVMSEVAHTALAFWQIGRSEEAWKLMKGALLDSMFLGQCPGNAGMCTQYDVARREAQRDFADSVGMVSRAVVEGLFGVQPDALSGVLTLRPGFPSDWKHASLQHSKLDFKYRREGRVAWYHVSQRFSEPQSLLLELEAPGVAPTAVLSNGKPCAWEPVPEAVGSPRIRIRLAPAATQVLSVRWPAAADPGLCSLRRAHLAPGQSSRVALAPLKVLGLEAAPESGVTLEPGGTALRVQASSTPGTRRVFAQVSHSGLAWWLPVELEQETETLAAPAAFDWTQPLPGSQLQSPLVLTAHYNLRLTELFKQQYLSPRSPFASLSVPTQGIGSWCHPKESFEIDDRGLRAAALNGSFMLPNGLRFDIPGTGDAANVLMVSLWDNFPDAVQLPLSGKGGRLCLLMAGTTTSMQSRIDNGEIVVEYTDGSTERLALRNPETWWPLTEDYFVDDYAFRREGPVPPRVDLATGKVRLYSVETFKGKGGRIPGGAATVLDLPLDPSKELRSLTLRALSNDVLIGLLGATVLR